MDIFSSVVLAIVFLSGTSVGALITAVCRYAARDAIQREFQSRLAALAEQQREQDAQTLARSSGAESRSEPLELSPEDFSESDNAENFAWVASHRSAAGPDVARL